MKGLFSFEQSMVVGFYCVAPKHMYIVSANTVVSDKKGTFICELILERYIYLRNTQKQLKITNYVRNKSLVEFHLVYNDVFLKLLGSLL